MMYQKKIKVVNNVTNGMVVLNTIMVCAMAIGGYMCWVFCSVLYNH